MQLTLTAANTAYPAPPRSITPTNIAQAFRRIAIVNNSGFTVFVGQGTFIISGGYPATRGLPIATGEKVIIPASSQVWMSSETAGAVVDYEYFN